MQYLHIIPPSKRMMDTYIAMIRKYFVLSEHKFYFIQKPVNADRDLLSYENVDEMSGNSRFEKMIHLYKALKKADIILWHQFLYPGRILLFLFLNTYFLKKSIWIMWGIDLYNWKRPERTLRNIIINYLNKYCRLHMKSTVALIDQDCDYFHKSLTAKIPCHVVPLPMGENNFTLMDSICNWLPRKNSRLFIQIAHNAFYFNRHIEILESLLPFKDENIRLFLPLSYGGGWGQTSANYLSEISSFLKNSFEQKAYSLYRLMPPLEYTNFLWNMDIAIFNAQRQNGLGNILKLLYMGNKVFLPSDGPLYQYFLDKNINVYDTLNIQSLSFEEFTRMPNNSHAKKWIKETYHPDYNYLKWKRLFDSFLGTTLIEQPPSDTSNDLVNYPSLYKTNYLNIQRYLKWNYKINLKNVKDVTIVGPSELGKEIFRWMKKDNLKKLTWFIAGFIDKEISTLNDELGETDNVGSWNAWEGKDNCFLICALEDIETREYVINLLSDSNTFLGYHHCTAYISDPDNVNPSCIIGPYSILSSGVQIGEHTHIRGGRIGYGTHIGRFCNIGYNCQISNNVTIGDYVTIYDNTIIPKDTIISDRSIIV